MGLMMQASYHTEFTRLMPSRLCKCDIVLRTYLDGTTQIIYEIAITIYEGAVSLLLS